MNQVVDFAAPGQARAFWAELDVEARLHTQPVGRRFLGALQIDLEMAEALLDLVAANFRRLKPFTSHACTQAFDNVDRQLFWCRITTLALSEFAYHRSAEGPFWKELTMRLTLDESQATRNCFYDILRKGFTALGVVQAHDQAELRHLYVATLYLQNGIPVQHQKRFAALLAELRDDYGWWEIAHSSPEVIAELLYGDCRQRHAAWGTILRFLSLSCPKDGEVCQPISGELTQSLAMIATELDRRGLDALLLNDATRRERLLAGFDIPNAFFLRDWSAVSQLLRFNPTSSTGRRIHSMQRRPLSLRLDPEEWGEVQLVLPPQQLYKSEWKNRSSSFCQIPEVNGAEFDIDTSHGVIEIDREISTPMVGIAEFWRWQLRFGAGEGEVAVEWVCRGPEASSPVLLFDPVSGERLEPGRELESARELVVFTPKDYALEQNPEVEVLERIRWCSIKGWWGLHLEKGSNAVTLTFRSADNSFSVDWKDQSLRNPQLRGKRIYTRQLAFSSVPELWIPPLEHAIDVHVRIDDLNTKECLNAEDDLVGLEANSSWQCIDISDCIQQSSRVAVVVWLEQEHPSLPRRWEQVAHVDLNTLDIDLTSLPTASLLRLSTSRNEACPFTPKLVPLLLEDAAEFWLPAWRLTGLWPFETVTVHLRSSEASLKADQIATARGELEVEMATFRHSLDESEHYEFSLQRQNDSDPLLICALGQPEAERITWEMNSESLTGMRPRTTYQLTAWNLLDPSHSPEVISLVANEAIMHVDLMALIHQHYGLYFLELLRDGQHLRSLGWWSVIQSKNEVIPDGFDIDLLANLLDNEPPEAFEARFADHPRSLSDRSLTRAVEALSDPQPLPAWIDREILKRKLGAWLHAGVPEEPTSPPPAVDHKEKSIKISLQIEPIPPRPWSRKNRLEATRTVVKSFQKVRQTMGIPPDDIRIENHDDLVWATLSRPYYRDDLTSILNRVGKDHELNIKQIENEARRRALYFHVKLSPPSDDPASRRAQSEALIEALVDYRRQENISPDSIQFSIDQTTALPVIMVSHKELREKLEEMLAQAESEFSIDISLIRKRE